MPIALMALMALMAQAPLPYRRLRLPASPLHLLRAF